MKKLILVILNLTLTSCAISYNMPTNRFETTETSGGLLNVKLGGGLGMGQDVELTPDFSQTWINANPPVIKKSVHGAMGADFGLHKKIDVGVHYITDMGIKLKAKWQIIGEKFKPGFQLATALYTGAGGEDKSENNHTYTRVNLDTSFSGVDFILGYRINPSFLFYTSAFYDDVSYEAEQTRGTTQIRFKGGSRAKGASSGISYVFPSQKAEIIGEFARKETHAGLSRSSESAGGGYFVLHF